MGSFPTSEPDGEEGKNMKRGLCGKCFAMMLVATFAIFGGVVSAWGNYWSNTYTNQGITWKLGVSYEDWNGTDPRFPPHCYLRGISGKASVVSNLTIPSVVGWDSHGSAGIGNVQLTSIQSTAFSNYSAIYEVRLSDITKTVYVPAFRGCKNLRAIHAQADWSLISPYWSTNGVLFRTNALVKYPEGKTGAYFEVPATVASLRAGCLAGTKLSAVRFLGDKPTCGNGVFDGSSFVGFCPESWGLAWEEKWNGITMYPIPANGIKVVDGVTNCYEISGGKLWIAQLKNGVATITDVIPPEGDLAIPPKFRGCPVTEIRPYAFYGCTGLTTVVISSNVTSIGRYAFSGCSVLTNVTIPDSVTSIGSCAFDRCAEALFDTNLIPGVRFVDGWVVGNSGTVAGALDLPGVRGISDGALSECSRLTSVTIPSSVTSIGDDAFYNCTNLTAVHIHDVAAWCGISFGDNPLYYAEHLYLDGEELSGSLVIPDGVTSIGQYAFFGCSGLTSVAIGNSVTNIGERAFDGCDGLTSVTIPDSVTSIGGQAFEGCSCLTSVAIGNSVTNIGVRAFEGCNALTSVTIPSSVTSIGNFAFDNCTNLMAVHIHDVAAWCGISFGDNPLHYAKHLYLDGEELSGSLEIPDSVTSIGNKAFYGCGSLTSVTIPDSVVSIGTCAFTGCSGLTNVTIQGNVTNDWDYWGAPFRDCTNIATLVLGENMTKIGDYMFRGCHVTSVTILGNITNDWSYSFGNSYPPFYECGVSTLVLGEKMTKIGNYMFYECPLTLTYVTIPDSVTSIGDSAFGGCIGLMGMMIPDSVRSIGAEAFAGCYCLTIVTIPDSVTSIGSSAFSNSGLKTLYVPAAWEGTSKLAYTGVPEGCKVVYWEGKVMWKYSVTNGVAAITGAEPVVGLLTIPEEVDGYPVTDIGDYAFQWCSALMLLDIPDSVTNIGFIAFSDCHNLTSVTLGSGVQKIDGGAFSGCSSLANIQVAADNSTYTSEGGVLFSKDKSVLVLCRGEQSDVYSIPDSVTGIGDRAFRYCRGLTNVTIPDSVTIIGEEAFYGCSGLTGMTIPDSVTSIGERAFDGCADILFDTNTISGVLLVDGWAIGNMWELDGPLDLTGARGIADRAFSYCRGLTSVTMGDSVTDIGNEAFNNCSALTSVTIGNSVLRIGDYAFCGCSGLEGVVIPDSVTNIGPYAFYGCSGLTSVTIGNRVRDIGRYAFYGCSSLTSMTIPDSVTNIGSSAFLNSGLRTLYVPAAWEGTSMLADAGLPEWCEVVYWTGEVTWQYIVADGVATITGAEQAVGRLVIPAEVDGYPVTGIGDWAFQNCNGLTSVSIPDSVTNIWFYAFASCYNLTSVTLGSGVKALDGWAFYGCFSLTDVQVAEGNAAYTSEDGVVFSKDKSVLVLCPGGKSGAYSIPDSVETIGDGAFGSCHNLTSVTLGSGVRKVDQWTFNNCFSVTNFQVAEGNAAYASEGGVLLSKDKSILVLYPRGVYGEGTIPDGVERIGENAFFMCRLTSVDIPDSVTDIGDSAFASSSGLVSVSIPESVTNIGDSAFSGCSRLTEVTIPDSVATIGRYAFDRCSGLTSASIPAGVTNIGHGAFEDCSNLVEITVAPDNARYSSQDGILCSKAGDILICCPGGKSGAVEVSAGVKRIESDAFYGCGGLTSVTIPENVESIGRWAFWGCDGVMDKESIPGVFLVDGWVVGTDYNLAGAVELDGVRGIAEGGFNGCGLTSVSIPASVVHIGEGAFSWCDDLSRIDVAADNPAYTSLDGVLFNKDMKTLVICPGGKRGAYEIPAGVERLAANAFMGCFWLEMETLPGSVGSIGAEAFDSCDSVVRMVIPGSVTNIGGGAFQDCDALESVVFPGSVAQLEENMFNWCPKLTEVRIGEGVTGIGGHAFRQCSALASLTIPGSVASVGKDVFEGCSALKTLYVPAAWEGTDMLADAAVPAGCTVVYRGGSEEPATQETPVPVAHSWLEEQAADILAANGGDYEAAAKAPAANGLPVWQCYVAGLSTTDAEAEFKVKSISLVDGAVRIEWDPDLNDNGTKTDRRYIVQGKQSMSDEWGDKTPDSRFFRVKVGMPEP